MGKRRTEVATNVTGRVAAAKLRLTVGVTGAREVERSKALLQAGGAGSAFQAELAVWTDCIRLIWKPFKDKQLERPFACIIRSPGV